MAERDMRRDNRNDPVRKMIVNDPDVIAAMDERYRAAHENMQDCVEQAVQATDERKLKGWVCVAVWEDASGKTSQTVMGDDHSTFLEMKGYLHDAVWTAAHTDA
ncbi:MAG: hypothetical protein M3238_08580 [Actinomycetota bacterium]|nr:hypothetical protein [Actinomycetota bacterium]